MTEAKDYLHLHLQCPRLAWACGPRPGAAAAAPAAQPGHTRTGRRECPPRSGRCPRPRPRHAPAAVMLSIVSVPRSWTRHLHLHSWSRRPDTDSKSPHRAVPLINCSPLSLLPVTSSCQHIQCHNCLFLLPLCSCSDCSALPDAKVAADQLQSLVPRCHCRPPASGRGWTGRGHRCYRHYIHFRGSLHTSNVTKATYLSGRLLLNNP